MLNRLFRSAPEPEESRSVSYQAVWGSGGDWTSGGPSWSGSSVTPLTSLQISTVYACVRIYCDTLSTLPIGAFVRLDGEREAVDPRPEWLDAPGVDGELWGDYVQQGMVSLLLDGNWFTRIYRDGLGRVVALQVLDPTLVEVRRGRSGEIEYVWNQSVTLSRSDVLHLTELRLPGRLRGESRITQLRQTMGLAQELTKFSATFFANGSITTGIIETPAELNEAQATQVKTVFEKGHKGSAKSHRVGVLGGGAKFVKTGVDPEQAQMLESKRFAIEEIASVFRVPLNKLSVSLPGAQSYASVEQNNIAWATDSVRAYADKIESAHSRLLRGAEFVKLNMAALLRGDTATRYSAYSTGLTAGWVAINEVRRLEDMPAIDGGDVLRVPLANVDLPAAGIVETEKNVGMAVDLVNAGFDPASVLAALGLPPIEFADAPEPPEPIEPPDDDEEPDTEEPTDPADDMAEDDAEETP